MSLLKFLAYVFYFLVCTSFLWVPFLLFMWFVGAFDSCHEDLIVTCP